MSAMKKVLVLNGSPHRAQSTTMAVTDAFVRGMVNGGSYEAETIHLADLRVTPCTGCLSCWGRTEGVCVIRDDDMPAVRQKIREADVVLASFPLYFFGIPGQMKVFVDRLLPLMSTYAGQCVPQDGAPAHRPRFPKAGQKVVLISSCAYVETAEVYDPILKQCDLICGKGGYTALLCPQVRTMVEKGGSRAERAAERFVRAGEEFAATGALSEETLRAVTRPPFSQKVYETVLAGVWERERQRGAQANGGAGD